MSRNDEIIWDFFRYIVVLPENDYKAICECMRQEEPMPSMSEHLINKANKKRGKYISLQQNDN